LYCRPYSLWLSVLFRKGTVAFLILLSIQESFSNRLKELSEPSNTNLYISNLPLDVDEQVYHAPCCANDQRLDELLKPHRVHSSRILRDQNKTSRGVGFAR
jgi:hypothetical protein